uniref:Photosystem I reaction center subunit XI, chloroplastic n=2 Tax=Oryza brachyantha TaxID=4533 RepID=J3ND01_ORYBR
MAALPGPHPSAKRQIFSVHRKLTISREVSSSPRRQRQRQFGFASVCVFLVFCSRGAEMATAYAPPMASQLMKSSLSKPRGLPGASLTRRPRFTIKAIQPDKATYQVVQPINGDPFIGSLETPVTSSPLVAWYLSNLPAYRTAVSPLLRGIEVGLAHGYLLLGPFALTGPLRNTPVHGQAGALGAIGLVSILSVCLTMYGVASFGEGEPSTAPTLTLTGRQKEADKLQTADGWAQFTGGFFFGGVSGALWAYFLLYVLDLPYYFK